MKTIILLSGLSLYTHFFTTRTETSVYVCDSPKATKYHFKKNCRGLQRCTHTISTITKAEAEKRGYTVCKAE